MLQLKMGSSQNRLFYIVGNIVKDKSTLYVRNMIDYCVYSAVQFFVLKKLLKERHYYFLLSWILGSGRKICNIFVTQ